MAHQQSIAIHAVIHARDVVPGLHLWLGNKSEAWAQSLKLELKTNGYYCRALLAKAASNSDTRIKCPRQHHQHDNHLASE